MRHEKSDYKYLFGPVRSRRLGISLGVDMVPYKTCTLNCIYCECGATTDYPTQRGEFVPTAAVKKELDDYLSSHPEVDFVTFGGSGEPTLHSGIGEIARFIKDNFPQVKTALLTNSTFFHMPDVRQQVLAFDLILPSLDAVSQKAFVKINKPMVSVDCEMIIEGLEKLSAQFKGQIWLEVFIVPGINDTKKELTLFKEAIERIKPTRVQLNSLDRPGTCSWLTPASAQQLQQVADFLMPLAVEIIARNFPPPDPQKLRLKASSLLSIIKRRPSTVEDLSVSLGMTLNEVSKLLDELSQSGTITSEITGNSTFFRA